MVKFTFYQAPTYIDFVGIEQPPVAEAFERRAFSGRNSIGMCHVHLNHRVVEVRVIAFI